MEKEFITRRYLETLSFSDLSKLADEYGVEVPDNLNRRFLIAEILELADEPVLSDDMVISEYEDNEEDGALPANYSETQVICALRNPAWIFIFWNISPSDLAAAGGGDSLVLRILFFDSEDSSAESDSFDVKAAVFPQEQYVLVPPGKKIVRVQLGSVQNREFRLLAVSSPVGIPCGAGFLNDARPGAELPFPEIALLSGMDEAMKSRFVSYRQSFS